MSQQLTKERKGLERQSTEPKELQIPPRQYQPNAAEKNETIDMPGMSLEQVRKVFMRPFRFKERANGS
ncbi:MAG: hypothetical protein OXG05_13845 [Gammaproteobacteria bacterium]|nr:hypothetical protein [Gammaproteobacteria bacterium]